MMSEESSTNIIVALRKAVEALHVLSEKDFATADRKAYALRAYHEANNAAYFDPSFGDYFAWSEDSDYGGSDIESACDQIEIEEYQIVQLTRVAALPDIFVVAIPDKDGNIEYETYDTEKEADDRATAAEEAASGK
jgi:hypothetical protein